MSNNDVLLKHQTNERLPYSITAQAKKINYLRKKLNPSLNRILLSIKSNEKLNHLRTLRNKNTPISHPTPPER